MSEQIINSRQSLEAYKKFLDVQFEKDKYLRVNLKTGKQRSPTQNRSLHLFCGMLADALNDAGYDMKRTLKEDVEIPWTMESVKENLWKPVQVAVVNQKSTTTPKTHEYGLIYDVLMRHLSQKFGLFVAWPSKDSKNGE